MDAEKLSQLTQKVIGDAAGAVGLLLAYIGDQSKVYTTMDELGPSTVKEIADKAGLDERYLREFLSSNAANGYVTYESAEDKFSLSPEQAAVFAKDGEPTCLQGYFQAIVGQYAEHEKAVETFQSGKGRPWGEHHLCCFCGTDRFFRPGYVGNLVSNWIPSLSGVEDQLKAGAKVADIGCGLGSTTIIMAQTYPNSTIHGYDFHGPSIEEASARAKELGLTNIEFHVSDARDIPDNGYDFACIFDALHDMGDPVGVANHIKNVLSDEGTFMLVEPAAADHLEDNLNTFGGLAYGFSTIVCVPTSRAQDVGLCLGAQAGPKRLTEVLNSAGFNHVRESARTGTNMVFEVKQA